MHADVGVGEDNLNSGIENLHAHARMLGGPVGYVRAARIFDEYARPMGQVMVHRDRELDAAALQAA